MDNTTPVIIGLYGIGLDTYWDQFEGLHDRLLGYQDYIFNELSNLGVDVINAGLIDNPEAAKKTGNFFAFFFLNLYINSVCF